MFTGAAFDPFRKPKARSVDPGRTRPRNGDSSLYVLVDVCIYVYICMCIYIYMYNCMRMSIVGCNINTPRKLDSRV